MPDLYDLSAVRKHPDLSRVIDSFKSQVLETHTPERAVHAADICAQNFYLTGKNPVFLGDIHQACRMLKPTDFKNAKGEFDQHNLTLNHLPRLARALILYPAGREKLAPFLGQCLGMMQAGTLSGTNLFVTLRAVAMCEWALYGYASAARKVELGFGPNIHQWGLPLLLKSVFRDDGYPNFDRERMGHLAWCARPACVWLCRYFDGECPRQFYQLPVRTLLAGNVTPSSIVGHPFSDKDAANDEYKDHPCLGPLHGWIKSNEVEMPDAPSCWALDQIKKTATPDIDWLTAPHDTTPGWRPPLATRRIGPWFFKSDREVTFTPFTDLDALQKRPRVTTETTITV